MKVTIFAHIGYDLCALGKAGLVPGMGASRRVLVLVKETDDKYTYRVAKIFT